MTIGEAALNTEERGTSCIRRESCISMDDEYITDLYLWCVMLVRDYGNEFQLFDSDTWGAPYLSYKDLIADDWFFCKLKEDDK